MLEARQPVGIVTKSAMIARDADILSELAKLQLVRAFIGMTTLDDELQREMEPRASSPQRKLAAIRTLADSGVPIGVMAAPVIPGLNDAELPTILEAVAGAGAKYATYTFLRLPGAVRDVFLDWLERLHPLKQKRVENLIRSIRNGKMNETEFGTRMRGQGPVAEQVKQVFKVFAKRFGLDQPLPPLDGGRFEPPQPTSGQLRLF
jgi:DNA repair photolyase